MDYGFTPNDFNNFGEKKKKNTLLTLTIVLLCIVFLLIAVCSVLLIKNFYDYNSTNNGIKLNTSNVEIKVATDNVSSIEYSSVSDMIANVEKSVVAIGQTAESTSGSGVVISNSGFIITNYHVVEGLSSLEITFYDGESVDGYVYASDQNSDLAVVYVSTNKELYPATFGSSDSLRKGDSVYAIGNPTGELRWSVTGGIVSYNNRLLTIDGIIMNLIQIDASVNPGNSGGALFNERGELVGIVNAKIVSTNVEGIGFAIPSDTVKPIAEDLIKQKYVSGRPYLGITVVTKRYQTGFFGNYTYKFIVESSSYCEDINVGDEIVTIGGKSLANYSSQQILNGYSVGDTIEIVVVRDGKTLVVNLVLEEYKGV